MEKVTVMADGQNNLSLKNELVNPAGIKRKNDDIESTLNPEKKQKKCSENEKKEDLTDPIIKHKIRNFKISSEDNDLFITGYLFIPDSKRYGLVGLEKYKKTALLKHIANIPKGVDVLYWDQDIVDDTLPAIKAVLKPSTRCCELIAERAKLMAELDSGNDSDEVVNRLAELREELLMIDPDGTPADRKASDILFGLGFSIDDLDKTMINLPERLRNRLSLARALYLEPALLILEEPTTDLDLDAILWLENYLQDWTKPMIVVSQDRCFLDNVCNKIIHLGPKQFYYFGGNLSLFEKKLPKKRKNRLRSRKKKLLKAKGNSVDAGVKSQDMTGSQSPDGSETLNSGGNIKPLPLLQKTEFRFLDPIDFKRKNFLQMLDVTFDYGNDKPIFDDLSLTISYNHITTILGPSQAGKTTLFKLACNELEPQKGSVTLKPGTTIGKLSESAINDLPSAENPLEYLCRKAGDEESFKQKAVDELSNLGLPSRLHTTKMGELTANNKALVVLAELCLFPHDGILLHEPERYMDLKLIDGLADAMNVYKGGILLVTNNEYLIRETRSEETGIYVIKQRNLKAYDDFEKYRKKVLDKLDEPVKGSFIFKKRTKLKREISPARNESDSEIIRNYIKENNDVDPTIKNIGDYRIIFHEGAKEWTGYSPTLRAESYGKTKEICRKNVIDAIERQIENLINYQPEVPPPPPP